ncbi:MAG: class I SAM-dependent methyltransferase [Cyanobacteria bacterium P01_F01_bin.143]
MQNTFSTKRDISTEFDQWAKTGRGDKMAAGHRYATEHLLDNLAIADNSVVLDAGCGIGWILNDLIGSRIAQGIGIDLSAEMIAIASSRCTLPHLEFLTADISNTPFESNKFSHIVSVEAIYYTPQPLETLKDWFRISLPQGRLGLVIDLYQGNPASKYWVDALSITAHNLSITDWNNLLSSAGWTNIVSRSVPLPIQTSPSEFKPSTYFPDYDIYRAYCEAGSLLLSAQKVE